MTCHCMQSSVGNVRQLKRASQCISVGMHYKTLLRWAVFAPSAIKQLHGSTKGIANTELTDSCLLHAIVLDTCNYTG